MSVRQEGERSFPAFPCAFAPQGGATEFDTRKGEKLSCTQPAKEAAQTVAQFLSLSGVNSCGLTLYLIKEMPQLYLG